MSVFHSYVAVPGVPEVFENLFLRVWSDCEVVERIAGLIDTDRLYAWASPRCEYLAGAPGHDVKVFFRSGDWAVMVDLSMGLLDEEARLARLSSTTGRVALCMVQGTAGVTAFAYFANGSRVRDISDIDGSVETSGTALPEEVVIDWSAGFTDAQLERLWSALGLGALGVDGPFRAIHIVRSIHEG